ncbi:MAG TPA: HAMP domain-containing sensor histidine kinase [Ktedonobacterales bacterium]|nr:HAMP domain-containing sensor histidine kinase [Ktedonobacterales bacterium]
MTLFGGPYGASQTLVTGLAYTSAALLALCVLTGLLALVLRAADVRKITLRVWLALAWLASLAVPALADLLFNLGYGVTQSANTPNAFTLDPWRHTLFEIAVPLVAFALTMASIAWLAGRTVLRPLAAMRSAARQIAGGDLDIRLPDPPLREVADVADAFGAMGTALRQSLERQAELEQQRRMVIGAVAHDLRTPLFSLRGYLEGLDRGLADTPERAAHYLAVCRQQADALERLVADLFTYTRLDYLEEVPRREPLELGALLGAAVEGARPLAEERRLRLVVSGPCDCALEGDAHLLTRAVENLLDNALRHSPPGGCVTVQWERAAAGAWRFAVGDSGPGIAPADLPHIFDPLYRGDASRNRSTGGAGLGLAIARRILRSHGGELTAANRPGGGAELTATLPCAERETTRYAVDSAADANRLGVAHSVGDGG